MVRQPLLVSYLQQQQEPFSWQLASTTNPYTPALLLY